MLCACSIRMPPQTATRPGDHSAPEGIEENRISRLPDPEEFTSRTAAVPDSPPGPGDERTSADPVESSDPAPPEPEQIAREYPEPVLLDIPLNPSIRRCVDYYLKKHPGNIREGLETGREYLPFIQRRLIERKLPLEIMWIPLVESGFRINACSPSYARGMWQLMPFTARQFGLRIDDWVDERLDPIRSTEAALDALDYFHKKMNCWLLAFAAYNAGEGVVKRAIRSAGTDDFWKLTASGRLPSQTRFYVNAILAVSHIWLNRDQYDFDFSTGPEPPVETIAVDHQVELKILAACAGITVREIRELNPSLKRGWTPPEYPGFQLKLPADRVARFRESFCAVRPADYVRWETHTVRRGDTLSHIARIYRSTVTEIMRANGLQKTLIQTGWKLLVPIGITQP